MYSFRLVGLLLLIVMSGCGDNLIPSGEDKRPSVLADSSGGNVTQKSSDFSVYDSNGSNVTLVSSTAGKRGAVFYFTMWCPICDSHMNNMRANTAPSYTDVNFYLVDYVSGSIAEAASSASANGYAGGIFTTLADTNHSLTNIFQATMGTTVVIDRSGIIRMNEDYRDGVNLRANLSALP
ncbi:MAG: redoxin domain-containing protein [Desulfuromonadales bacterium]